MGDRTYDPAFAGGTIPVGPRLSFAESIDREVFLELWPNSTLTGRAFLRVIYRRCYPHWPELKGSDVDG